MSKTHDRTVRIFVSSTFRDMAEERNQLMTHTWTQLRTICREREVELVEVDLRWGISEAQSTRKETLKLCLDEIRACSYFIGLLGERYGSVPDAEAFTPDLLEEQPWLQGYKDRSITELEILHGVLRDPDTAKRAFFYLRDPDYVESLPPEKRTDFLPEDDSEAQRQEDLKNLVRTTCAEKDISLREDYSDPETLAELVLRDLTSAIEAEFPLEEVPDLLTRMAQAHEAYAEARRRTYIARQKDYEALDAHVLGDGPPLLITGESGSGKSALLANWTKRWQDSHPKDFILTHYIGSSPDDAYHIRLMRRVMAGINRFTEETEAPPTTSEEVLRDFPLWLARARTTAEHRGVRFILVLDALNQLEDVDHARLLGWLPEHALQGSLRLVASSLPGAPGSDDPLAESRRRGWQEFEVNLLTPEERRTLITSYLLRYAKQLDDTSERPYLTRLATAPSTANPLYLKILLDELRVTGTHEHLKERLDTYLSAPDIPALLKLVLTRYQEDYETDRPGLVSEALGLLWGARRGLSETELLELLAPPGQSRLAPALWAPFRSALEDSLFDRAGILAFAHEYLRQAVKDAFAPDEDHQDTFQLRLADYFEAQSPTLRSCDELLWLLNKTENFQRLRLCLLDIDRFLLIWDRDEEELRRYWVGLGEEKTMGEAYLRSFETWVAEKKPKDSHTLDAANRLALFLLDAALYAEAEPLMRRDLKIAERSYGPEAPRVATSLNNLAQLLQATNRLAEAEPLMRWALKIAERNYDYGLEHPRVATSLNRLARLLQDTHRYAEAEPLLRRALEIDERNYGPEDPRVADSLNDLALLLHDTNRHAEAEPLLRRALKINERSYGPGHPRVAGSLNNLAWLLQATNRHAEAEPLIRRALEITERSYGPEHPQVATGLNNLALLLKDTNRLAEAEPLMRRALKITERSYGPEDLQVATYLNDLALLLHDTNRHAEAEPLLRRALKINERSYGPGHPRVAACLNNLALLLEDTNRHAEAEPLIHRALEIDERSYGPEHPRVATGLNNLAMLLHNTNRPAEAEPLMRRALEINERSYGPEDPRVAACLSNLAVLLHDINRHAEAEPLMRRALKILLKSSRAMGHPHPHLYGALGNYVGLLEEMGRSSDEIRRIVAKLLGKCGFAIG
jgi:nephrocystin-3